jgi:hypothetical protein
VVDRTTVYIAGMNKQISELNNSLTQAEKKLYELAMEKLTDLDNQCGAIKLEIQERTSTFTIKPLTKTENTGEGANQDIEIVEKELRALINRILMKNIGTDEAKKTILPHLQPKIEERIARVLHNHPGTDSSKYKTLSAQLQFFDMSEYFEIISNKVYWPYFKSTFNSKENLNKHILQLSNLRNALRHSREQTKLIIAEGLASILWFKMALNINTIAN